MANRAFENMADLRTWERQQEIKIAFLENSRMD
jgi:hypothetical protein